MDRGTTGQPKNILAITNDMQCATDYTKVSLKRR